MWSWRFWTVVAIVALVSAVGSALQHNWVLTVGMGALTGGVAINAHRLHRLENQPEAQPPTGEQ